MGFYERVENAPIVAAFAAFSNVVPSGGGQCQGLSIDLSGTIVNQTVSSAYYCQLADDLQPLISVVMIIVWSIIALRLFGTA